MADNCTDEPGSEYLEILEDDELATWLLQCQEQIHEHHVLLVELVPQSYNYESLPTFSGVLVEYRGKHWIATCGHSFLR